ncbi:MAG: glycosyltransferase [Nanoarchaeota archaeon]|nr:glycosyltransferase [Nanoarchaeota archaeon]
MIIIKISVVIAAYNEKENITELTERLNESLKKIKCSYEIIYFIDGEDGTYEILAKLSKHNKKIRVFFGNKKPIGLGCAFRSAFSKISKDTNYVITMDADLNHQPEEIKKLLDNQKESDADIVVGSRHIKGSVRRDIPLFKKIISNLTNKFFTYFFGVKVKDKTSGFRLYKLEKLMKIKYKSEGFEFLPEMLMIAQRNKMKIIEVPITFKFRKKGISKLNWGKTFKGYVKLIFNKMFKLN